MTNNKTIIPGLIRLQTGVSKIKQLEICDDLDFFQLSTPSKYNYDLNISKRIRLNEKTDQLGNIIFTKDGLIIYRKKLSVIELYFSYDTINQSFTCSKLYTKIPFQIGNIYPAGKIISDIMRFNLSLEGFFTCLGAAVSYGNKNYIILGASKSGKTTLVNNLLSKGGKYIAEDMLVIDINESSVYPTAYTNNYGRAANQELKKNLDAQEKTMAQKTISNVIFLGPPNELDNYLFIYALNFLDNTFVKSMLYKKYDSNYFIENLDTIKKIIHSKEIIFEKDLDKIIKKIGK